MNVVIHDSKTLFWIAASVADAASVNPNDIKTFLANGSNTFFIKGKPFFSNGSSKKCLLRNPPNCWVEFSIFSYKLMNSLQRIYEVLLLY